MREENITGWRLERVVLPPGRASLHLFLYATATRYRHELIGLPPDEYTPGLMYEYEYDTLTINQEAPAPYVRRSIVCLQPCTASVDLDSCHTPCMPGA